MQYFLKMIFYLVTTVGAPDQKKLIKLIFMTNQNLGELTLEKRNDKLRVSL